MRNVEPFVGIFERSNNEFGNGTTLSLPILCAPDKLNLFIPESLYRQKRQKSH